MVWSPGAVSAQSAANQTTARCNETEQHSPVTLVMRGQPDGTAGQRFRQAAQRGVNFVSREAVAWQGQNNCYGCHVQAVTLDALMVAREHQYDVSARDFETLVAGMTTSNGGSRNEAGRLFSTGQAFSGATFARYDATVNAGLRSDLLHIATRLTAHQQPEGNIRSDDTRFPVEAGDLQATTQALQTWRQVYERSGDERWLAHLRGAEAFVQQRARTIADGAGETIVDANYAVMGLLAAGASPEEQVLRTLSARLRQRQNSDGGWGYRAGEASNAFATGQTLYALRLLGADDNDGPVSRGMGWLVAHQGPDGSWSHTGSGKAEAMWSVLGLVALDQISVSVVGLRSGQHVANSIPLRMSAQDNRGGAIASMEVLVDDVAVFRGCGAANETTIAASGWSEGMHSIDVVATTTTGASSRRHFEVYAGNYFLLEPSARREQSEVVLRWRNLTPSQLSHRVQVSIVQTERVQQRIVERELRREQLSGTQGLMQWRWDGRDARGAVVPEHQALTAVLQWTDLSGRVVQTIRRVFAHENEGASTMQLAVLRGQVVGTQAHNPVAHATVQLVDAQNNVLQETVATRSGQYQFSVVPVGEYRVRAARSTRRAVSSPLQLHVGSNPPVELQL